MVHFDFEGDVENVRPRQLEFISDVLEKRGFRGSRVTVEPVGEAGDNYMADVKRISVKENGETFTMIAKVSQDNEMIRTMTNSVILFNNETVMYTEVLPKFVQLQKSAGVPDEEQFKYAACYGSLLEPPNEIILLEDLKVSNFVMLDRFKPMTDVCVRSVLKNFAIFHSLSYILKYKEPETFRAMKSRLKDMWPLVADRVETKLYFSHLEASALAVVDNNEHKQILKGSVTEMVPLTVKLAESEYDSKYSVIQQGDAWTNNIMFKLKNGTPVQSILIDYQLSKEFSPVCDLLYMIFNGTDHKTRLKHFHNWIEYYHNELDKCLHNYDLKATCVYPRDLLNDDLKRYGRMLFGQCILLANMLTKKSEDASKLKDNLKSFDENQFADSIQEMLAQDDETQVLFKERVQDIIDSFLEFELL